MSTKSVEDNNELEVNQSKKNIDADADAETPVESKPDNKFYQTSSYFSIDFQLSDVIRLEAPSNKVLDNNTFIITYINNKTIKLVNIDDLTSLKIKIGGDGMLGDGSITSITLIYRSDEANVFHYGCFI